MMKKQNSILLVIVVLLGGCHPSAPSESSSFGLSNETAIEYGQVIVRAKWQDEKTWGTTMVYFKTPFDEPPVVVANGGGGGGWFFFVHCFPEKDRVEIAVMLDRSMNGREPREHDCHVSYIAIGKRGQ